MSSSYDGSESHHPPPSIDLQRSRSYTSIAATAPSAGGIPASGSDRVIMVMGVTGSGKSSFINHIADQNVRVGHSLASCTTDPETHTARLRDGQTVYLIDTPGFDDTTRSDSEVLRGIAFFLNGLYQSGTRLSALIYMHRITDVRMSGSAVRNLELFRKICGTKCFSHVALVSTMWEMLRGDEGLKTGQNREATLLSGEDFWGELRKGGSRYMRHYGTAESAWKVLENLPYSPSGLVLELQREMYNELSLDETAAGSFLQSDLIRLKRKYDADMLRLQEEIEEARAEKDFEGEGFLRTEQEATVSRAHETESSIEALSVSSDRLWAEKAPKYRRDLQIQGQKEIAQDPILKEHADKIRQLTEGMRQLEEELEHMRHKRQMELKENYALDRQDRARSSSEIGRLRHVRKGGSRSPLSQREAELEAERHKCEEEKILLNKFSLSAWVMTKVVNVARDVAGNLRHSRRIRSHNDSESKRAELY